jgi:hypothetical protein
MTWSAYHSCDGVDVARNTLSSQIFDGTGGSRNSRAAMAGKIQIPLRGCNTFTVHAAQLWNASPALHTSKTKAAANWRRRTWQGRPLSDWRPPEAGCLPEGVPPLPPFLLTILSRSRMVGRRTPSVWEQGGRRRGARQRSRKTKKTSFM